MKAVVDVKKFITSLDWDIVGKGFVNGFSLYAALPILRALFQRRRVSHQAWTTAAASGVFFGGFRLISQLALRAKVRKRYVRAGAGALAALSGLMVDDSFVSSPLVIWWALRAVRTLLPKISHPVDGSVLAICGATSLLAPSALMFQGEHSVSYQRFMDSMALGIDRYALQNPNALRLGPSIHYPTQRLQTICDTVSWHKGHSSCARAVVGGAFPRLLGLSLRLYTPLYLAWSVSRGKFKARNFIENVLRSSAFLSLYSSGIYLASFWYTSTINAHMQRGEFMAATFPVGFVALIERKERRPELATYCMTQGLNAVWNLAKKNGYMAGSNRKLGIATVVVSTAVLMYHHKQHSQTVRNVLGLDLKMYDNTPAASPRVPLVDQ